MGKAYHYTLNYKKILKEGGLQPRSPLINLKWKNIFSDVFVPDNKVSFCLLDSPNFKGENWRLASSIRLDAILGEIERLKSTNVNYDTKELIESLSLISFDILKSDKIWVRDLGSWMSMREDLNDSYSFDEGLIKDEKMFNRAKYWFTDYLSSTINLFDYKENYLYPELMVLNSIPAERINLEK